MQKHSADSTAQRPANRKRNPHPDFAYCRCDRQLHQTRQHQESCPPRHQIHDDARLHQEPYQRSRSRSHDAQDIELVNDVIFNELCLGKILDSSRKEYQRIITEMKNRGAEGVILGCTEIGMLISAKDSVLPTYDTTIIHATEAAKMALE